MSLEHSPTRGRRLLRAKQVMDRMGWSRTTLWRRIRSGEFPAPVQKSQNSNSIGFYEDLVDDYQAKLPRVSYAPEPDNGQPDAA